MSKPIVGRNRVIGQLQKLLADAPKGVRAIPVQRDILQAAYQICVEYSRRTNAADDVSQMQREYHQEQLNGNK
ncbi:MAG: hypothetical protein ACOYD4_06785 [Solirubrobacterales bacterium]